MAGPHRIVDAACDTSNILFDGCARVAPGELAVLGLIKCERLLCRRRNASHWRACVQALGQ